MRILVVTQYFWPENFRINDLVLGLKEKGHHVEVLTGKPNYPTGSFFKGYSFFSKRKEVWKGVNIHRSAMLPRGNGGGIRLLLNYFSFAFFCSIRALFVKGKFDQIFVYEPSPITVALPGIVLKQIKKAKLSIWVQDLWPQSVTAAGGLNNKFVLGALNNFTIWIYKNFDKILIQSEAFREIIKAQKVPDQKIFFFPNGVEEFFKKLKPKADVFSLMPEGFNILFAGNVGEAQDFDTIVAAASLTSITHPNIKWVVVGNGRRKDFVEEKIQELKLQDQIFLLGSYQAEDMPHFFACADCLLVSLKNDHIFSLTIPSKLQSYLACSKAILGSLDGEGQRIIMEANAGMVAPAQHPQELAKKAIEMSELSTNTRETMGNNGRAYFDENFDRNFLLGKLETIMKSD